MAALPRDDLARSHLNVLISSKRVRKTALAGVRVPPAQTGRQILTTSSDGVTIGAPPPLSCLQGW